MQWGGLVSSHIAKEEYGFCDICDKVFKIDQSLAATSVGIKCPSCKDTNLVRGLTREQAREKLDDVYKELLS